MAYREVDMWEILEVLRRLHRGEPNAAIERATGRTRKTIRRYKQRAGQLGWQPGGETAPDEELAAKVLQNVRPVTESEGLGAIEAQLMAHRGAIRAWVSPADGSRGLRLAKVHDLLARQGVRVPYSSLHRFAVSYCGFRERQRVTVRVADVAPGELAEIDFGRLGREFLSRRKLVGSRARSPRGAAVVHGGGRPAGSRHDPSAAARGLHRGGAERAQFPGGGHALRSAAVAAVQSSPRPSLPVRSGDLLAAHRVRRPPALGTRRPQSGAGLPQR